MANMRWSKTATLLLRLHRTLTPTPQTHLALSLSKSLSTSVVDDVLKEEERKRALHNKLLYRSKQRGFLELDLVLGGWVEENIKQLDDSHVSALVHVLDLENPDLWKWLTGQEQPPDEVNMNPVFKAVQAKVLGNLDSHSAPETRAKPGQPWVRGWDDKRGQDGSPKYGNQ